MTPLNNDIQKIERDPQAMTWCSRAMKMVPPNDDAFGCVGDISAHEK